MPTPTRLRLVPNRPPAVFVSYAHENERHRDDVLRFSSFLVSHGIDACLDRWATNRRRDWQVWATRQVQTADFIAVIASPTCRDVGDGIIVRGRNAGLHSEMRLLREFYHRAPETWIPKFLPVVLSGHTIDELPAFLQPATADHYLVEELTLDGAGDLLRAIFGLPTDRRPALGSTPRLFPPRAVDLPPACTK